MMITECAQRSILNITGILLTDLHILQLVGKAEEVKVDEAALTGESMAVSKSSGDKILSGAVIQQGEAEAMVIAVGPNTFFGKTITLLSREEGRGHLQQASNHNYQSVCCIASEKYLNPTLMCDQEPMLDRKRVNDHLRSKSSPLLCPRLSNA